MDGTVVVVLLRVICRQLNRISILHPKKRTGASKNLVLRSNAAVTKRNECAKQENAKQRMYFSFFFLFIINEQCCRHQTTMPFNKYKILIRDRFSGSDIMQSSKLLTEHICQSQENNFSTAGTILRFKNSQFRNL